MRYSSWFVRRFDIRLITRRGQSRFADADKIKFVSKNNNSRSGFTTRLPTYGALPYRLSPPFHI